MATLSVDTSRRPSSFAWPLCAAASLASSKYLLVDAGLHYPFHLFLLQTIFAILLRVLELACCLKTLPGIPIETPTRGYLLVASLLSIIIASSSILTLQALLHFPNLATIAMLSVFCYAIEQTAYWTNRAGHGSTRYYLCSLTVVYACCSTLVLGEYRPTATGLATGIPALLLAGVARAVFRGSERIRMPRVDYFQLPILLNSCMLAIGIIGSVYVEGSIQNVPGLTTRQMIPIFINVATSAIALNAGGSVLTPFSDTGSYSSLLTLVAFSGYASCFSTILPQRSYTSSLQLGSYIVAVVALAHSRHSPEHDTRPQYLPLRQRPDLAGQELSPTNDNTPQILSQVRTKALCTLKLLQLGLFSLTPTLGRAILMSAIVGCTWAAFIALNFSAWSLSGSHHPTPILDLGFATNTTSEVVISMYDEPPASVAKLIASIRDIAALSTARVHIYTKDATGNTTTIQDRTKADQVSVLPNIGREGETYLYHILNHWDTLARHTLFIQANVHNEHEAIYRLRYYFDPQRTGMLSLGFVGHTTACQGSDQWGWTETSAIISSIYKRVYQQPCKRVLLSYKGQFIVSAERIRGVPKGLYDDLYRAIIDQDSWAHQEPYLKGRVDSMNAPLFGYTLERLWNVIFQCSDLEIAWRCPSLLSKSSGSSRGTDCQCMDRR